MAQGKENKIQSAIAGALQVYCQDRSLQLFPPYANQQGEQLRKYCGDLFGLVDNADLIALEVKELDVTNGVFPAFDDNQHEIAMRFESIGVPLAYAYNAVETLPYHQRPQPPLWARSTLASVKRSMPTPLPGRMPDSNHHQSLLDWLDGPHGTNAADLFGRVHGAVTAVDDLRNGILVLLYAVPQQTLVALAPADIIRTINVLRNNAHLSHSQRGLLERLLGASSDVFDRFVSPATREERNSEENRPSPGM
ncbi:hypothetical protein P3T32_005196 [Ralstonia sp. GP73]|jgi:hypothetical protein|uniref:Uncharacterized protein n=1 Tax=Ralstonia thomasii TaxID=3058596 RepID=A0ABM9JYU9_9RALS|nr:MULTISPECIES: hypothetical protein [unclassified Ralstonia]MDH6645316.1 hypothetical protein [Ralstonia sp. GP73]CAJ0807736.1 hypothetical protein LMG18095_04639 [Ralstonia sp. LMG 18095]